MQTLADKYPDIHEQLKARGYRNIAHCMTIFGRQVEMDKALGLNSSTSTWMNGKCTPNSRSEQIAADYLKDVGRSIDKWQATPPDTLPKAEIKAPEPVETDGMFLVTCPPFKAEKVGKVLAMLGCEVVEV
jgi:hypothetical protein